MDGLKASPQKIGLVLRGGGFLGSFEVGALAVIEERKIPIHMGAGDSVGAINGNTFFAEGFSAKFLSSAWLSIKNSETVFDRAPARQFLRKLGKVTALYRMTPLLALIGNNLRAEKLVAQPKEFWTAVTHLESGRVMYVSQKDPEIVADPIKGLLFIAASCAIPGLFPPVPIHYRGSYQWYIDGAFGRTLPIRKCIAEGCDTVIVLRCHSEKVPNKVPRWWGPGLSLGISMHNESKEEDEIINVRKEYPNLNLFVIEPESFPETLSTVSFRKGDFEKAAAEGKRIARRELEPLIRYFQTQSGT